MKIVLSPAKALDYTTPALDVPASLPGIKLAPSAIPVNMGAHSKIFATPIAMTEEQIEEVIGMFVTTATRAIESGFDGVQVHAAHGYLLSQFLSPLVNRRTDRGGGGHGCGPHCDGWGIACRVRGIGGGHAFPVGDLALFAPD